MIITKMALPRRTFLRGMGVSLALPFLDAMVPAMARGNVLSKPAMRLGFFYVPNGVVKPNWLPKGAGTNFELSPTLASLAPYKDKLVVIDGLSNREALKGKGFGPHAKCPTAWLSGAPTKETEGADLEAGPTLDQLGSAKLGEETPLRSLEMCTEPNNDGAVCEPGLSCVYHNTISWRTATTPLTMENNPRVIFERLFGEGGSQAERKARTRENQSILDWVSGEISTLRKQLGASDNSTVNEYLEAVREVEQRIDRMEKQTASMVEAPSLVIPESGDDHIKLLLDLQFLAYRSDVTRVVSYLMRREESQITYPQIGVPDGHHDISHHGGNPEKMAAHSKVNAHHVKLFSHLVERMQATRDGDGTLLDHTIFMYGSGMSDGNLHNPFLLPVFLLGGGCGTLKGGRFLTVAEHTPMMNLGLSLMDRVGLQIERIGDSTGRLSEL